jgi:hypothetical protein
MLRQMSLMADRCTSAAGLVGATPTANLTAGVKLAKGHTPSGLVQSKAPTPLQAEKTPVQVL